MPEADDVDDFDLYIGAEVLLPNGLDIQAGTVVERAKDSNGQAIGSYDKNPICDSRLYDVMFPDGRLLQYSANLISESIMNSVTCGPIQWAQLTCPFV